MTSYWYNVAINVHHIASIITPILTLLTAVSGVVTLVYFIDQMSRTNYQPSFHKIICAGKNIFFYLLCAAIICSAIWALTPGDL